MAEAQGTLFDLAPHSGEAAGDAPGRRGHQAEAGAGSARGAVSTTGMLLLCGPSNSGKVAHVHSLFLEACRAQRGAWLVVPTQVDVARTSAELVEKAGGALPGAQVGTFHALVRQLSYDPAREPIGQGTQAALIGRLLDRRPELFSQHRWPGFASVAARTIGELRSLAAVDPDGLKEWFSVRPHDEAMAWSTLLGRYSDLLQRLGLRDLASCERDALAAAADGSFGQPVYAYGFDDLSEMQLRLLEHASRHAQVALSLPFEEQRPVFERRAGMIARLTAIGAELELSGTAHFRRPALAWLERSLFERDPGTLEDATGIELVEASGALQEAEAVVRAVARQLAAGVPAREVACLTASPGASRGLLAAAFARAGIGVTFQLPTPVGETPIGRAVSDALEAATAASATDDAAVAALLRLARSGRIGVGADAVDRAERRWQRQRELAPWLAERVAPLRTACAGDGPLVQAIQGLLDALEVRTAFDARTVDVISDALDDLRRIGNERFPLTADDLRRTLRSLQVGAPVVHPDDHVLVAPISRMRTDRFDTVVLFGLHQGGWATAGAEDEREHAHVQRELAYVAVTRPRDTLVCIRQAATSDGRARAPHPLWSELVELTNGARNGTRTRLGLDAIAPLPAEAITPVDRRLAIARAAAGHVRVRGHEEQQEALARMLQQVRDPHAGDALRARFATDTPTVSVTELERYGDCPARWFIDRQLLDRDEPQTRAQVLGTLTHELLALMVPELRPDGTHPPVAPAYDAMLEAWRTAATGHRAARMLATAELAGPAERDLVVSSVELLLRDEQPVAGTVLPEVATGGDERIDIPNLVIDGVQLTGRIDRIDIRTDGTSVVHDYKRSNLNADWGAQKLIGEGKLQLPLYWKALADSAAAPPPVAALYRPVRKEPSSRPSTRSRGIVVKGAAGTVPPVPRTDVVDEDTVEQIVDQAVARASEILARMRSGDVEARPRAAKVCEWCRLQPVCRIEGR